MQERPSDSTMVDWAAHRLEIIHRISNPERNKNPNSLFKKWGLYLDINFILTPKLFSGLSVS
jgi:hypothetical protein